MAGKIRAITVDGDIAFIPLTRGLMAIIDAADIPLVEGRNWCADPASGTHYVVSAQRVDGKKRKQYLHRLLSGSPAGVCVDHINRDGLDNRRENLRNCTTAENARNAKVRRDNKAGLKGVAFISQVGKWLAQIKLNQKRIRLGHFDTADAAHAAYCEASRRLHGEYGRTA